MPDNASLYVRLSGKAEDISTGHITQEADGRKLAREHGCDVVAIHFDNGQSGDKRNRQAWLSWISDAREGRANVLIAPSIDRVSRGGLAGMGRFLDVLAGVDADGKKISEPVRCLTVKDRLDSQAPGWDMQVAVLSTMAKMERDLIQGRILRSVRERQEQGRFIGGTVPKGFRKVPNPDGVGSILEVYEPEAHVLRQLAEKFISGESSRSIVRWLNEGELRPARAKHWSIVTAKAVLRGKATQDLFSPAQRRALGRILAPDPDYKGGGRQPTRLLSGLVFCDGCGRAMYVGDGGSRNPGWKVYRCQSYSTSAHCPAATSISASLAEAKVTEMWLDGWGKLALTQEVWMADERADRIALLEDAVDEARREVANALRGDRKAALAALEALEDQLDQVNASPIELINEFRDTGLTWAQAFGKAALDEKRDFLRRTIGSIRVLPGNPGGRGDAMDRLKFKGMVLGPGTGSLGGSSPKPKPLV